MINGSYYKVLTAVLTGYERITGSERV